MEHIVSRNDDELIKKVFLAQKETPTQGDFVKLLEKDLEELHITYEDVITNTNTKQKLQNNCNQCCVWKIKRKT